MNPFPTAVRRGDARPAAADAFGGLLKYGYAPFMLIGLNGVALLAVKHDASQALPPMLFFAIGLSFGAERLLPYRAEWNHSHGDRPRDTLHAIVNELANALSVAALPLVAGHLRVTDVWPRALPLWLQVLLAVLLFDAGITLTHWLSHRVAWLWRFHAVHHSVKRMYGLNGLMKHPVHQAVEMLGGTTLLVLFGLSGDVATALAFATAIQLLLQHSNVAYDVGPLRHVLALNEGHRFHHLKWAGVGDVNFGLFTLLWDHLLGTYAFDPGRAFTSDDVGLAAAPEYPVTYGAQLVAPFRRRLTAG